MYTLRIFQRAVTNDSNDIVSNEYMGNRYTYWVCEDNENEYIKVEWSGGYATINENDVAYVLNDKGATIDKLTLYPNK